MIKCVLLLLALLHLSSHSFCFFVFFSYVALITWALKRFGDSLMKD